MHRVRIDLYKREGETFRVLIFLQRNFTQLFFITRHANTENFIQIDQKRSEL